MKNPQEIGQLSRDIGKAENEIQVLRNNANTMKQEGQKLIARGALVLAAANEFEAQMTGFKGRISQLQAG